LEEPTAKRLALALLLVVAAAALSGLLLLQHHGEPSAVAAVNEACGDGAASGCQTIAESSWSKLGGLPLAAVGLGFYLVVASLLALAASLPDGARKAVAAVAVVLLAAGLGADVVLACVQAFVVKTFCLFCTLTYVLNLGALAALWPARRALATAREALGGTPGRTVSTAAALLAVASIALVGVAEAGLRARARVRQGQLLGAPAPAAAVDEHAGHSHAAEASAPALPPGASPDQWRAEAQRLQGILDDPHRLEQYFNERAARQYSEARVEALSLANVPAKGAEGAPVQVVEYSDFLCPFCRNLAGAFQGFLPQSGNRLRIFYKNYPLDQTCNPYMRRTAHAGACTLALGAICAQEQGKFWEYHDRVFGTSPENAQVEDVVKLGSAVGLDGAAFRTCVQSKGARDRLAAEIEEAHRVGVEATPTLFVNGKKLPRINDFVQVIDQEARAKGFPPLKLPNQH
jgi:protein-disulfide isomerase/uncharacterized membrane protein